MAAVTIVKLGGSLITDKTKPRSFRSEVVSAIGEEIASSRQRVVLVHGGGSFGHPLAKEYGFTSSRHSPDGRGVSKTRAAMYELNMLVCKSLIDAGVQPYAFSPFDLLMKSTPKSAKSWLNRLLSSGLSPITFGDVSSDKIGFTVLSGDTIMYSLARILRPVRCVFAMDVDGVYQGMGRNLLRNISAAQIKRMKLAPGNDATGGIKLKLDIAAKIAAMGTKVGFVSGFRRREFSKCLSGLDFFGTVVR